MSTHPGYLAQDIIYQSVVSNRWTVDFLIDREIPVVPITTATYSPLDTIGTLIQGWPKSYRIPKHALWMPSFMNDFYNRIHITPSLVDLSFVPATTLRTVEVWNSYFDTRTLTSISANDATGITVTGASVTLPHDFLGLEAQIFNFTVSSIGPATIAAGFTFNFSNAESTAAAFQGFRTLLFAYSPNWARTVIERIEYLTDVLEARSSKEQRINLRRYPRQILEYGVTLHGSTMRQFNAALFRWHGRQWAIPLWFHGQKLQAGVAAGATTLAINTNGYEIVPGTSLAIFADLNHYESVEVLTASAFSVTLLTPTLYSWPLGVMVYPLRTGWLRDEMVQTRVNADVTHVELSFTIEDDKVQEVTLANAYHGLPVLDLTPNRINNLDDRWTRRIEMYDYDTSHTVRMDLHGFSYAAREHDFTQIDRDDIYSFRNFVHSRKGRWKSFWAPTYNRDMVLVQTALASENTIFIEWQGYTDNYQIHETRRDILIELRTGVKLYRRVTGADDTIAPVGTEALTLDATMGVDVTPANVLNISFLLLSRFDSDRFEINWHTPTVASCSATIKNVLA